MQHVVQIGHYAWVAFHHGQLHLTSSGAHAERFEDRERADALLDQFHEHRAQVVNNSPAMTPAARALYADPAYPVTVLPAADLDARLHANQHRGDREKYVPAVAQAAKTATKPEGVTRRIYNWVLDNPQATRADAVAAFPGANPTTVGVQFGAARRSQQN